MRRLFLLLTFCAFSSGQAQLLEPSNRVGSYINKARVGSPSNVNPILFDYAAGDNIAAKGGTFTRASVATYLDATGIYQTAVSGAARDGHYLSGARTLLLESARTNLLLRSQEFENASWSKGNLVAVTTGSTVAPDGTATAETITPNTSTSQHRILQGGFTGTSATHSVYVKANGYNQVGLRESAVSGSCAVFNLSNGTVAGTHTGGTTVTSGAFITALPNGWYRIGATFTHGSSAAQQFALYITNGTWVPLTTDINNISWTGDGTSGVFLWGAQMEAGATASTPILTTSATVTRAADSLPFTLGGKASWTRWEWYYNSGGALTETITTGSGSYSFTPAVDRSYRRVVIATGTRDAAYFAAYKL